MSTGAGRLAALLWAAVAASTVLAAPSAEHVQALEALRHEDPRAFLAALRAVERMPPADDPQRRDQLGLLGAHGLMLESRFSEALQQADRLASEAHGEDVRMLAAALGIAVKGATRDVLEGQKRLESLLGVTEARPDDAVRRHVDLVAAAFYNQLSQSDIAMRHAERVLAGNANPEERCSATVQTIDARLAKEPAALADADFDGVERLCAAAATTLPALHAHVLRARWWTARGDAGRAAAHLQAQMPALVATGHAPLLAAAHAQFAEALQRIGRLDEAQAQTEATLALSAGLPSGLPLLSARRTRYAIAIARGDHRAALRELQAVLIAERAYEDEMRRIFVAYETGRQEALLRQQALALVEERNAGLALDARHSERTADVVRLLLVPLGAAFCALLAWAWHSRRLRRRHLERLQVDPLTTLWSRQHFTQRAAADLLAAARRAQPMALVMLDLDHFSQVNSRHGHLSGDRVLAAIGATLARVAGPGRHFGRLGGEEFAVLLAGAGLDEGLGFAERCRSAIAATQVPSFDGTAHLSITASFGVVSTATAGYRLSDLLASADQAQFRAKAAGRNRVAAAVVAAHDSMGAAP
ncbi:hypothetical protein GCM10028794_08620 [Silanimonas algicola]